MRNEIGLMEDNLRDVLGKQLHLEVEGHGVYDYDAVDLFDVDGRTYLFCLRVSEGREGFLMTFDDLGDGWYTLRDITDNDEWERALLHSDWETKTSVVHR